MSIRTPPEDPDGRAAPKSELLVHREMHVIARLSGGQHQRGVAVARATEPGDDERVRPARVGEDSGIAEVTGVELALADPDDEAGPIADGHRERVLTIRGHQGRLELCHRRVAARPQPERQHRGKKGAAKVSHRRLVGIATRAPHGRTPRWRDGPKPIG
jgi:hypothetical protein